MDHHKISDGFKLTFGSLFAGIGGFDLGLERIGMICKWQVEIDPFCQKVLKKHWPNVPKYEDIKNVGTYNLEPVDLICGGFPCQPFSVAGKQRGKKDNRYLWPEMLRVIKEFRPTWVIGENVPGIVRMELDQVLSDLEDQGYETQPFIIPACGVDAPHRRNRVWIVANTKRNSGRSKVKRGETNREKTVRSASRFSRSSKGCDVADASGERQKNYQGSSQTEGINGDGTVNSCCGPSGKYTKWLPEPDVGRVANGIPRVVDRLRSLGNAVVPQIIEVIGKIIIRVHKETIK